MLIGWLLWCACVRVCVSLIGLADVGYIPGSQGFGGFEHHDMSPLFLSIRPPSACCLARRSAEVSLWASPSGKTNIAAFFCRYAGDASLETGGNYNILRCFFSEAERGCFSGRKVSKLIYSFLVSVMCFIKGWGELLINLFWFLSFSFLMHFFQIQSCILGNCLANSSLSETQFADTSDRLQYYIAYVKNNPVWSL